MGRKLNCMAPVESMVGKLTQVKNKTNDEGSGARVYVGFVRKTQVGINRFACKIYGGVYKSAATETAARQRQAKFRAVSQAAHERKIDPLKKPADEAAFKAQSKYKTMFGFLFHLEWIAYEG